MVVVLAVIVSEICVWRSGVLQGGVAALRCLEFSCSGCASPGRDEKIRNTTQRHHIRLLQQGLFCCFPSERRSLRVCFK